MDFRLFFIEEPHHLVVLLNGFEGLDKHRLAARAGPVNHSLHAPLLLYLHRDHKAFTANRDQLILHPSALGQLPQIAAQGLLNHPPLLFNLPANARQLRGGAILERAVGQNLVAKRPQKFSEVGNQEGQGCDGLPLELHGGRGAERDLAPLGGPIHHLDDIANFHRFQSRAGDPRLLEQFPDIQQARKIEAPAHPPEFPDLARELLLGLNPAAIGGRPKGRDALPAERRGSVPAQQVAQRFELERPPAGLGK